MNQTKEILIIEDTNIGETYQELLTQHNSTWHVTWVKTFAELQNLDFLDRLHVFVFDQRLSNNELGTEAFKYVHEINPRIQGIMLSGVAMAKDYAIAQDIAGRSKVRHLVKDDVLQLPDLVTEAISAYYTSIQKLDDVVELTEKMKFRLFSKKPKIVLLSHYILDENFTFDESWEAAVRVRSGEGKKIIEATSHSVKKTVVIEVTSIAKTDMSYDLKQIKNAISTHFESSSSKQIETTYDFKTEKEYTYKLPDIPTSPTEDFPVEIKYMYNDIFQRIRAHVSIDCPLCGIKSYCDFDVFIPKHRLAWKQVAHYALGSIRETRL